MTTSMKILYLDRFYYAVVPALDQNTKKLNFKNNNVNFNKIHLFSGTFQFFFAHPYEVYNFKQIEFEMLVTPFVL